MDKSLGGLVESVLKLNCELGKVLSNSDPHDNFVKKLEQFVTEVTNKTNHRQFRIPRYENIRFDIDAMRYYGIDTVVLTMGSGYAEIQINSNKLTQEGKVTDVIYSLVPCNDKRFSAIYAACLSANKSESQYIIIEYMIANFPSFCTAETSGRVDSLYSYIESNY